MIPNKAVKDVGGTDEFRTYFELLSDANSLKKELREAFMILKENCLSGQKIQHDRWPAVYVRKVLSSYRNINAHYFIKYYVMTLNNLRPNNNY